MICGEMDHHFLELPSIDGQTYLPYYDEECANEELVRSPPVNMHTLTVTNDTGASTVNLEKIIVLERFESRLKLLRVTELVMKPTCTLVRNQSNSEPKGLPAAELKLTEELLVKSTQQQAFPNKYSDLLHKKKTGYLF